MRAAILRAHGETPRVETLPDPGPLQRGEIMVRMLRAPINPADRLTVAGAYSVPIELPMVLGAEGVGVVVQVGEGVGRIRIGDHILPLSRGNWATGRVVRETDAVRVRRDFPLDKAAMLRINPATAWRLLHLTKLQPGDWIVQNGATSSVGRLVRTFARGLRINVVNVVRDGRASLGGDPVLEDGPDLAARITRLTGDAPINLALDCVAGESSGNLAACLGPGGCLAVFGHLSGAPCAIPSALLTGKQLLVRGFSLRPAEATESHSALQALYDDLARTLSTSVEQAPPTRTYPLEELEAALRASAERGGERILLALDA